MHLRSSQVNALHPHFNVAPSGRLTQPVDRHLPRAVPKSRRERSAENSKIPARLSKADFQFGGHSNARSIIASSVVLFDPGVLHRVATSL